MTVSVETKICLEDGEINMEKEIKITLVPKEQINEEFDCVRITCENVCAWGDCLEAAIKAFDEALRQHR